MNQLCILLNYVTIPIWFCLKIDVIEMKIEQQNPIHQYFLASAPIQNSFKIDFALQVCKHVLLKPNNHDLSSPLKKSARHLELSIHCCFSCHLTLILIVLQSAKSTLENGTFKVRKRQTFPSSRQSGPTTKIGLRPSKKRN